jgi:hypothetical protein
MVVAAFGLWRMRAGWWRHPGPVDRSVRARAWVLGLGLFGLVWWLGVAIETQAGFSGNNRYLVLGTAPVAIVGGVAWGWFAGSLAYFIRRLGGRVVALRALRLQQVAIPIAAAVVIAVILAVPRWIGSSGSIVSLPRTHHALVYQAHLREDLTAAVREAGGPGALLKCGGRPASVMTEGFQVPMVAWTLGVHTLRIQAPPSQIVGPPGPTVILQTRAQSNSTLLPTPSQIRAWQRAGVPYRLVDRVRTFRVFSACTSNRSAG